MDVNAILKGLPTKPNDVVSRLVAEHRNELGGDYTVARRVSRQIPPDVTALMCGITPKRKRGWFAECTCTACNEVWYTQWNCAGSISVYEGPDSQIYPMLTTPDDDELDYSDGFIQPYSSGGRLICPECGARTTAVFASDLHTPRRTTRAFQTVELVGSYGAVVAWLGSRRVDRDALIDEKIVPWRAVVVDENGKLQSFAWEDRKWRHCKTLIRAELTKYNTPDGSIYGQMVGTEISLEIPPLVGTTLEKTGLREYLTQGGVYPTEYLRFWSASANIENLMKSPFAYAVRSICDESMKLDTYNSASLSNKFCIPLNLEQAKPRLILEMDKASYRHFCKPDAPIWSSVALTQWLGYHDRGGKLDAVRFYELWLKFKADGIDSMLEMMAEVPGLDLDRIDWYLCGKQGLAPHALHLIPDMWRFARRLYMRPLTDEELWPRNLWAAHDRFAEMTKCEDSAELQAGFDRVRECLHQLEYSDGDLCVVIPASNSELVREGEVLQHCVGSFGKTHISGKPIFFIRHHRRPERPYYTLNIDLTGITPNRLQLHGYGNEHHGEHKSKDHKIPQKVLAFCAAWEKDILAPFWAERMRNEVTA